MFSDSMRKFFQAFFLEQNLVARVVRQKGVSYFPDGEFFIS
jgi:hypothetical protein